MTQSASCRPRLFGLLAVALALAAAAPALAQGDLKADAQVEPWRGPDATHAIPRTATSSASAAEPNAAEQRESRKLATAIFAKPAAAARAADKAAPPNTASIPPAQPKPEWLAEDGVRPGGEGVKVSTPF